MIEVKEILRLWLEGRSLRKVTRLAGVDRKTARRYVDAAQACGLDRDDGPGQLSDELLGAVVGVVRPEWPRGMGTAWEALAGQREQLTAWLEQGLTLTKVHVLLGSRGVVSAGSLQVRASNTTLPVRGLGRQQEESGGKSVHGRRGSRRQPVAVRMSSGPTLGPTA